jgi:hypothetical protein
MGATSLATVTLVLLALLWTTPALANLTYPVTIELDNLLPVISALQESEAAVKRSSIVVTRTIKLQEQ